MDLYDAGLKNDKLNLIIDSCNLENIISFLVETLVKLTFPVNFIDMEANINQDSMIF